MAQAYASKQPAGYHNYIRKVAMVGAAGQQGKFVVEELLKTKKHEVTAITRADSPNTFPAGVKIAKVDYDSEDSLVSALRGHDALVITMSVQAPRETSEKLVRAAAKAQVPWILPNEWGLNSSDEQLGKDTFIGAAQLKIHKLIEELGSSWVAISCGFWYEYSLSYHTGYGFDIPAKRVTFFDDGNARLNTSTWEQAARAAAGVLSMKILPEDENDTDPSITKNFKNNHAFVSSFLLSQRDMLAEILKVTGQKESEWTVDYEPAEKRWQDGITAMKSGDHSGFVKLLYTRLFYADEPGNFEKSFTLANEVLGLPKENLDECTRKAVQWAQEKQKSG